MDIQSGTVTLSVLSESGREAVIVRLDAGEFFGEGCLAGQPVRMGSATASDAKHHPAHRQGEDGAAASIRSK